MKILVTGATGKVGRTFIDRILNSNDLPEATIRAERERFVGMLESLRPGA